LAEGRDKLESPYPPMIGAERGVGKGPVTEWDEESLWELLLSELSDRRRDFILGGPKE
jgi:hypothetical protein